MTVSIDIIQLGMLIAAFAGIIFSFWRSIIGSIERAETHSSQNVAELHKRIDDIKDSYVRREEFVKLETKVERIGERIESNHAELRVMLAQLRVYSDMSPVVVRDKPEKA